MANHTTLPRTPAATFASTRARDGELIRRSTEGLAAERAFEYWCAAGFKRMGVDLPADARYRPFAGAAQVVRFGDEEFWTYRSHAIVTDRSALQCRRDSGDEIVLCAYLEGATQYRQGECAFPVRPGALFVADFARPMGGRSTALREVHLVFPRATLVRELGRDPGPLAGRVLEKRGLAPMLFQQMRQFGRALPTLTPAERRAGFESIRRLCHAVLRSNLPSTGRRSPVTADAAMAWIEANAWRTDLTPEDIRAKLGCSRATLYRILAEREWTVHGFLREVRLQQARGHLSDPSTRGRPISEIALACGFADPAHFARLFRSRFGASPSEFRSIGV